MVGSKEDEATVINVANSDDGVKAMEENADPTAGWDLNKVWVYTDPDGNKVPVPKGFTVSGAESERYVNHNVKKTGTLTELTFTPGEKTWEHDESDTDKAWMLNEDGVWVSQNYNVHNSDAELVSNEFTVGEDGGYLSIECSVSSYSGSDKESPLLIKITNVETRTSETPYTIRGTRFGTNYNSLVYAKYSQELEAGTYTITITYSEVVKEGLDRGYLKSGTILNYDSEGMDTATIHKAGGLVIYEGIDAVTDVNAWNESMNRNQFVWIPVADTSRIYKTNFTTGKMSAKTWRYYDAINRSEDYSSETDTQIEPGISSSKNNENIREFNLYGMLGYTKEILYKELNCEYIKTIESIKKYGGFYIGRYETGNIRSMKPVVRRLNSQIGGVNWYNAYIRMRNVSTNENIQTSMIWESLYEETLEWLIESGDKTRADIICDSSNWGNYQNIGFNYIDTSGETNIKRKYKGTTISTGSAERNKANNIYDLAGNVYDRTLGKESELRNMFGGCSTYAYYYERKYWQSHGTSGSAGTKKSADNYAESSYFGFRAFLYIK